jgi:hypothetical protein
VCVGQLLVVKSGEEVPADLLCLATGLEEDVAFVRTVSHARHMHCLLCSKGGALTR